MEKAVAIDPDFAMAYRSMAMAYGNIGFRPQQKINMEKALELSYRLSVRERYFIEADHLRRSEKTMDMAIEKYEKLLALYPDDSSANHNLAIAYWSIGEKQKAIEHYEINWKNDDLSLIGYGNLASDYREVGSYDKAREVIEEALQRYPDNAAPHQNLALHYRMEGKYDLALAEINLAFALEPATETQVYRLNVLQRAQIYFYSDNFVAAAEDYRGLQKQKEPQAIYVGSRGLVNLNILQGKFKETKDILRPYIDFAKKYGVYWPISEIYLKFTYIDLKTNDLQEALKDCDNAQKYALKAETPNRLRLALHLNGLAYLQMNSIEESLRIAEELRVSILESHNPQRMHYYHHLRGMIDLKQKNFPKAIESFEKALGMESSDPRNRRADYIESLAKAYAASGDIARAYARSFYELGKIYEQKGWKGKAIEQYEKFLDLWKDADPGFPEVAEARLRLTKLKEIP
jgi:tetratricopeptide (TPR) repeat protein